VKKFSWGRRRGKGVKNLQDTSRAGQERPMPKRLGDGDKFVVANLEQAKDGVQWLTASGLQQMCATAGAENGRQQGTHQVRHFQIRCEELSQVERMGSGWERDGKIARANRTESQRGPSTL
jgi:hypothetical protein